MGVEYHAHVCRLTLIVECLIALEACVRQILITDVLTLHAGLQTTIVEGEDIVEDHVWRERQPRVTQVLHRSVHQRHLPVLGTVLRERGVGIPTEPVDGFPGSLQFNTQAIALTDILGNRLTDVVQLTRQHKLVLIRHPVDVGTSRELLTLELIADLQVVQALCLQFGAEIVLIVVTCRLLMGDGIRGIHLMVRRDVVVQSELRVEEVELVVDDGLTVGISPIPVARMLHLIADMTVLQVDESVQARHEVVVHLAIDVPVGLLRVVTVVFEVWQQLQPRRHVLHPLHESEVVAAVLVPATAEGSLDILTVVIHQRGHHRIEVIVHLLLTDQVALQLRRLLIPGALGQILHQLAPGLILLVVAVTLRIVGCHVQVQHA